MLHYIDERRLDILKDCSKVHVHAYCTKIHPQSLISTGPTQRWREKFLFGGRQVICNTYPTIIHILLIMHVEFDGRVHV